MIDAVDEIVEISTNVCAYKKFRWNVKHLEKSTTELSEQMGKCVVKTHTMNE